MKPLDISLMGCLVTDLRTGAPLGRIRTVEVDHRDERIDALAIETILPNHGHPLVGQRLFNSEGQPLGTVMDIVSILAEPAEARILLWLQAADAAEPLPPSEEAEVSETGDFMIGQIAACPLRAPNGELLVEAGGVITLALVKQAKRYGILHRLEARFPERP
ncbi:MAG: hypothetical protein ACM3YO_05105 [Bacteroidota bacterium]